MTSAGQEQSKTFQIDYRITAITYGPSGLIYRCRARRGAPAGWSTMTLPSYLVPPDVNVGDQVKVTGLEQRRRFMRLFPSVVRTVTDVRRA